MSTKPYCNDGEERIESESERVLRIADELEDSGVPRDRPAAALVSNLPISLRRAVLNELRGDPWRTVELRKELEREATGCSCLPDQPEACDDCGGK